MQHASVDDYIAGQPAAVQSVLQEIRRNIHESIPGAGEMISYGIPTVTLDGHYVVYFAAWKHHISIYPVPRGDDTLNAELEPYLAGKGTLKFVLAKPIPYGLIGRVAAQLAAEGPAKNKNGETDA
ncbi:DUF1801 domain-containing protein [Paenarthrobacter nitroguajacolicus]|uniref:DUF1801 domain-containing protein n=1 Tax=Paenarthrobacter nitroguajacolicus TaxID=211146 RepID=A0A558H6I2_PAENT|nr:DUF1801 domain-containing protein [Paenarthrobacter nitroguajacolicus]TVU64735.1 DUF1801 domain-containing protein [Paenarthrobacter nitroguajacolicus]